MNAVVKDVMSTHPISVTTTSSFKKRRGGERPARLPGSARPKQAGSVLLTAPVSDGPYF